MAALRSWLQKFQALLDVRGLRSEADLTGPTRFIHFWLLLGRSFIRNRCPIRASALSYTTLLAMIPMLALAIGVTSFFLKKEGEIRIFQLIDGFVAAVMPPSVQTNQPAPLIRAVEFPAAADSELIASTNFSGVVGGATTNAPAVARAGIAW